MKTKTLLVVLFVSACGRGVLVPGPEETADVTPPQATTEEAPVCVPAQTTTGLWDCEGEAQLEVKSLSLVSWAVGKPAVFDVELRNRSPDFIDYPGVRVDSSTKASGSDYRYG